MLTGLEGSLVFVLGLPRLYPGATHTHWLLGNVSFFLFFFKFYLFIHEGHREREAETQAEGEAGSMQGARLGTRSQVSTIMPGAEGGCSTAEPPGDPHRDCFLSACK